MKREQLREHAATIVVAALSSLFAVALILGVDIMVTAMDPALVEEKGTFWMVLMLVALIFILIALYVGSIVTANTFSTIIAGRTRTIALYRLIGATSAKVRSRVAAEGLVTGLIGALIGFALAEALIVFMATLGPTLGWLPPRDSYPVFSPLAIVAVVIVALTTWIAAWSGSRRVAKVSPIEATGAAVEMTAEQASQRGGRTVWAILLMLIGIALMALGIVLGLMTPLALLISFFGGLFSFTGLALGAHLVMPPLLRLAGRALGNGPTGRLAAANAVRFPERSARATIGLVIGVTLVTMFAVALATYERMALVAFAHDAEMAAELSGTLAITTAIFSGLVGFSAVIAAVGMVNTLSLGVLQRTRELGLLRALGFTGSQVRAMVMAESVQMTFAALGFGLLLGTFYGWLAAQSLVGSQVGLMAPVVPWPVLASVAVLGVLLALGAAVAPARRAIRVSPVAALAVD
ncbi:FtsX-like permease family protein [Leucobacter sp. UT-8R-CII-1-4]|uniref:FtsX-like permease family protein n=1 Tax=Leucobacter sp. UT-8R-CII-1-4 TaxID=3040075 RepID=UPI0024A8A403|nr:FtsX-like permease family protein [Leucobacter sp. UT-8R-CII-1-4]MDI6022406.1 FtsX-like permease family protein [Leucobacter sp. UT-8R-CII-1-4]